MIMAVTIYLWLIIPFGVIYFLLIGNYSFGWFRLMKFELKKPQPPSVKTSVIIPARNEQDQIINLLEDLFSQSLSKSFFEVIIADDNSTDETVARVIQFREEHPGMKLELLKMEDHEVSGPYKKFAISTAIRQATGDLIITTDADCRVGSRWLATMVGFYETRKPKMIVGPVVFHHDYTAFEKMQTLEFLSLIAITGGAISARKPVMCNGANLAYEKKAFFEAGGFGEDSFASGDDVFLLLKFIKIYGTRSVRFLKNFDTIVYTEPNRSLHSFYHQRTRWASKNKGYDLSVLFVSFSVYMANLLILSGLLLSPFIPGLFAYVWPAMLVKIMIDFPVLISIVNFAKRINILIYALPLLIFYPVYIVFIGALGILGNYQWKGRKIKK